MDETGEEMSKIFIGDRSSEETVKYGISSVCFQFLSSGRDYSVGSPAPNYKE